MRYAVLILLLLLSGCGHRFAAQVVLEPSESGSQMVIGAGSVAKPTAVINPELPKVDNANRDLFAPGRQPF